jgi:dUTP pyrophosphatase
MKDTTTDAPAAMPQVGIDVLEHAADLPLPRVMTPGASGYDLHAACETTLVLEPGRVIAVPTGLRLEIPVGFEAQVRPRSGLAARLIGVLNSPGTIDADYRGEIKVLLFNFSDAAFHIERGDRVAQLVFARVFHPVLEVRRLSETERSGGGFGHTGSR